MRKPDCALTQARHWEAQLALRDLCRPITAGGGTNTVVDQMLALVLREASGEIEAGPQRPIVWEQVLTASAQAQFGLKEQARAALERLFPGGPEGADALAARGHVLALIGDLDAAGADLDAALRLDPANPLARFDRGKLWRCRRDGRSRRPTTWPRPSPTCPTAGVSQTLDS